MCRARVVYAIAAAVTLLAGGESAAIAPQQPAAAERCLRLELILRSDSPLCQEARKYAEAFVQRRGGICLEVIDTLESRESLDRYWELVRRFQVAKPRVPVFFACGRLKLGFTSETKSGPAIEDLFAIHAYVSPTCQHCRDATRFLNDLAKRWKAVRVVYHDLEHDPAAVREMTALTQRHGISASSFPIISLCGTAISGYRTDSTTGRQIESLLLKASTSQSIEDANKDRSPSRESIRQPQRAAYVPAAIIPNIEGLTRLVYQVETAADETGETTSDPPSDSSSNLQPGVSAPEAGDSESEETYTAPIEAPEGVELPWLGYLRVRDLGLPLFTLIIGLIDGFNPCAMWVLVFLLSVLANIKDRRKIAAIAGSFVLVSGLAYFAFMAAWLNVFMFIGIARPLQIALGGLAVIIGLINIKDFFAFKQGVTLSIPESAKPGIYSRVRRIIATDSLSVAIGLSVVLAVLVNVVELMCTAGLPAVYTQILTMQQLPAWQNYLYLALYNVAYMFDDALLVIAFVITLSHRKLREAEGRWLKLISGLVVLALGAAMLFRPDWLQW